MLLNHLVSCKILLVALLFVIATKSKQKRLGEAMLSTRPAIRQTKPVRSSVRQLTDKRKRLRRFCKPNVIPALSGTAASPWHPTILDEREDLVAVLLR